MKGIKTLSLLALVSMAFTIKAKAPDDEFCGVKNTAFQAGEEISYTVYYAVAGIYIDAGNATFTNVLEKINGRPVYHIAGVGKTNPSYDWIYKVRDKYETFIDTGSLQPLKFLRNVDEGGYKKYENVTFNRNANTAVTTEGVFKVPDCVQDVLSAVYYSRNIDFNKYNVNDKIPFSMFLDNETRGARRERVTLCAEERRGPRLRDGCEFGRHRHILQTIRVRRLQDRTGLQVESANA